MASPPFRVVSWLSVATALAALVASGALGSACADGATAGDAVLADGGGGPNIPGEAGVGKRDGGEARTTMRLAHLSPDLGDVDFCYRAANTSAFEGPVLARGPSGDGGVDAPLDGASDASDGDGGAPLSFASVSTYTTLEVSGPLEIAIVPGGAASCAAPLASGSVTLDPGKLSTVAVLGRKGSDAGASDALAIVSFTDSIATEPQKARARVVNAVAGGAPVAVRAVGAQPVLLAETVEPRRASSASAAIPVDELGYATIAPVPSPASLAVTPVAAQDAGDAGNAGGWQSGAADLDLRGGSLHTGFVLAGEGKPYQLLWCADTTTNGDRTGCDVVR